MLLAEINSLLFFNAFETGGWEAPVFMDVLTSLKLQAGCRLCAGSGSRGQ